MAKKRAALSIFDPENDPAPDVFAVKWSDERVKVTHYPNLASRKSCCSVEGRIIDEDRRSPLGDKVACLQRLRLPCGYQ